MRAPLSQLIARLQTLGLTGDEAKAYLTVLRLGICKVADINQETGLHRAQAYNIMTKLVSSGLVQETLDRPKRYRASNIQSAIATIQERALNRYRDLAQNTDNLVASLQEIEKRVEGDGLQQVRVITGVRNRQQDLQEKLASAENEVLLMVRPYHSIRWRSYVRRNLRVIASKHLRARAILEVNKENAGFAKWLSSVFEVRHYEPLHVHLHIIDGRSVTIGLDLTTQPDPEQVSALLTSYPGYVKMIREFFEAIWRQAMPLEARLGMLRGSTSQRHTQTQTRIIWGREAILTELVNLHHRAKKRITEVGTMMGPVRLLQFSDKLLPDGVGRKVNWRVICHVCPENLEAVKKLSAVAKIRHTDREFALGISVLDDSEAIIRYMDPDSPDVTSSPADVAICTSDESITVNMLRMLDSLWKRSEPLEKAMRRIASKKTA